MKDKRQKTKDKRQKTEDRRQKTKDERQKAKKKDERQVLRRRQIHTNTKRQRRNQARFCF
jgi:hypothetical protein